MAEGEAPDAIPFDLTETDRINLAQGDEKFTPHNWEDLREIIAANNLAILKRRPSDLLRYIAWTHKTKAEYGSITKFVCKERLHWEPLPSSSAESGPVFACRNRKPFAHQDDYKILLNDWPYGMTSDVTHIVVWLKTRIAMHPPEGYLTEDSREVVERFVKRTFVERLTRDGDGKDRVQCFKNWEGLQSVRGLEHFHVLVRDVPERILVEWTGSRTP